MFARKTQSLLKLENAILISGMCILTYNKIQCTLMTDFAITFNFVFVVSSRILRSCADAKHHSGTRSSTQAYFSRSPLEILQENGLHAHRTQAQEASNAGSKQLTMKMQIHIQYICVSPPYVLYPYPIGSMSRCRERDRKRES